MKALSLSFLMIIGMAMPLVAANPLVSNITASQRAGTQLVDICYSVTADTPTVKITLEISADGGTTWTVPAVTVSGAIGSGVATGTGKTITWNAGIDWPGQYSAQTRYRVTADDLVIIGFSLIPAGSFTMGDTLDNSPNGPHPVDVSAFYMAQNLATKTEWVGVRTWAVNNGYTDIAVGAGKADNHPIQNVTWWDVVKHCNARSQMEGLMPVYIVSGVVMKTGTIAPEVNWSANGYRLPTEAEWEKAARGGLLGKRFPWGDTISDTQANYFVFSINGTTNYYSFDRSPNVGYHYLYKNGLSPYTSPVGSFAPNRYGLYDMAGNLYQWCWDWYSPGSTRVYRGGSWMSHAIQCKASNRFNYSPGTLNDSIGFRLARRSVP